MRFHGHFHGRGGGGEGGGGHHIGLPYPEKPSTEFVLLDAGKVKFERDGSALLMTMEDVAEKQNVRLLRLFPMSDPEGWLSVLGSDGHEIGIIRELQGIDKDSRALILDELYRRYAVPEIRRIKGCREKFDIIEWEVETNRGLKSFIMRDVRENIQPAGNARLSLTDVDGSRYDIPDLNLLDPKSRSILDKYF